MSLPASAGQPSTLHQRAAQWYAGQRRCVRGIGHAFTSGDVPLSRRLVAAHWRQHFNAGQLKTVRRWLDALPAELVAMDASLSAARVWVALDTGFRRKSEPRLTPLRPWGRPETHLMVLRALHM